MTNRYDHPEGVVPDSSPVPAKGSRLHQPTVKMRRPKSAVRNAPELVFADKKGNFFLHGDTNRTQDQHLGNNLISSEQVFYWQSLIHERKNYLGQYGIEFLFIIGPDKQSVYWPTMGMEAADHRNSLAVLSSLDGVNWIDPVPALSAAAAEPRVYPITDSHWDMYGAYIAYQELVSRSFKLQNNVLVAGYHFDFKQIEDMGDLGNKFDPPQKSLMSRIKKLKMHSRIVYNNAVTGNGGFKIYYNELAKGIAYLCGDSYTQNMAPFLAEHFNILIHLRGSTDLQLIRDTGASLVIGIMAERFMLQAIVLPDSNPTEMLVIAKLRSGEVAADMLRNYRVRAADTPLPPVLVAAIARQDALADTVLTPDQETEQQTPFLTEPFAGCAAADTIVAAYLAWAYDRTLSTGWAAAYAALPRRLQDDFEALCTPGP